MNTTIDIIDISLIEINQEKHVIILVLKEDDATELYTSLDDNKYSYQYYERDKILIGLIDKLGNSISIKLEKNIKEYNNYSWLLNKVINKITTGFFNETGDFKYFEPITLNYIFW